MSKPSAMYSPDTSYLVNQRQHTFADQFLAGSFFFFLCFFGIAAESHCQEKYLVLDKPGRIKRIRYYVGDEINFKLKEDKTTYSTLLQAVGDSTIKVRDTDIAISDIRSIIRHSENGFLYQAARILPKAGILYFVADTFNPLLRGEKPSVSRSGIVVGSTLFAGGQALKLFRKRTLRINNYRTLKILRTF
jgi:hypothetical protein